MVRTAFSLVGLVICTLFWPATTRAQEISPRLYLFVEVADASGEVVVDATVRVSNADGKELLNLKTSKNGVVQSIFDRSQPAHHYDLQITKTGYVSYDSVLFPSFLTEQYFAVIRLTEEIPNTLEPSNYSKSPPIKITLRETPATSSEAKKQQLLFAAKRRDAASLRKLLQEGVDANSVDAKGVPAVAWATFAGDPETIKLLLDAGANVRNEKSIAHEALLIYLAEGAPRSRLQNEIIATLINAGVDVNASNSYWGTVLNKALNQVPYHLTIETIRALIKAGANVNTADADGQTPLMLAVRPNQNELVALLLSAGAKRSINAKDNFGRSALISAASSGRDSTLDIVKVLIANGALATEADAAGETPLMRAASGTAVETVQLLLKAGSSINAKDSQGQTPLMYALMGFHTSPPDVLRIVKLLLAAGARINDVDLKGRSALTYAARSSDPELIKLLIANGANVNVIDSAGQTALILAVQTFSTGVVQALLEAGASATVNATDNNGESALIFVIKSYVPEAQKIEIVRLLLHAGADVSIKNKEGKTPIGLARELGQAAIVKLIEESQSRP